MKREKRDVRLIDEQGVEWITATLTEPAIKRLIKLYKDQNIWLEIA